MVELRTGGLAPLRIVPPRRAQGKPFLCMRLLEPLKEMGEAGLAPAQHPSAGQEQPAWLSPKNHCGAPCAVSHPCPAGGHRSASPVPWSLRAPPAHRIPCQGTGVGEGL